MAPSDSLRSEDLAHLSGLVAHTEDKRHHPFKRDKNRSNHSHHLLKRFFKILRPLEHGENTPGPPPVLPLSLTSDLAKKYDLGALIGAGASGSVNLVHDIHDKSKIYAVKKFRAKLKGESDHDYMTKVKNEFLIGDYLLHQNLIHTMELIRDHVRAEDGAEYYIVMEYCPYDFFNLVMSGLMTKEEIYCYVRQIINGVHHLHKSGVAHRDLKLDNCVVDSNGVLKLIDFGSAFQFKKLLDPSKPLSQQILLDDTHRLVYAKGIVGSDPYLSPEVFSTEGYDPRLADVWSIAIIFCCMYLKRFPWKVPRHADPSYRAFAGLNNQDEQVSDLEKLAAALGDLTVSKDNLPKYGPERLLKLLPSRSRKLVGGMLEIDPTKRLFILDVVVDPFIQSIELCHYLSPKDHVHHQNKDTHAEEHHENTTNEPKIIVTDEKDEVANAVEQNGGADVNGEVTDAKEQKGDVPESEEVVQYTAGADPLPNPAAADSAAGDSAESTRSVEDSAKDSVNDSTDASSTYTKELKLVTTETGSTALEAPATAVTTAHSESDVKPTVFVKALNHKHHLVTERELEELNAERERARKVKASGMS